MSRIKEVNLVFGDIQILQIADTERGRIIGERNPEYKIVIATGRWNALKKEFKLKLCMFCNKTV